MKWRKVLQKACCFFRILTLHVCLHCGFQLRISLVSVFRQFVVTGNPAQNIGSVLLAVNLFNVNATHFHP